MKYLYSGSDPTGRDELDYTESAREYLRDAAAVATAVALTFVTVMGAFDEARIAQPEQSAEVAPVNLPPEIGLQGSLTQSRVELSHDDAMTVVEAWVAKLRHELVLARREGGVAVSDGADGSCLIEMVLGDRRFGIALDPTKSESSWYAVFNRQLGIEPRHGALDDLDIDAEIDHFLRA